jgi:AAA+ superfamily predicted ATPase
MDETSAASIKKVATAIVTLPGPVRYQLNGAAGSGRRSLARALAAEAGRSLTMVTLTTDLTTQVSPRRAASSVIAEALLTDSWVAILTDGILEDAQEAAKLQREWLRTFYSTIAEKVGGVFVVTEHLIALPDLEHACAPLLAPYPSATTQRIMWEDAARRHRTELPRALDADVLSRYVSLAPGSIDAAVARAVRMLTAAGTPAQRLDAPVLMRAVRQELSSRMGTVATRVEKHGRWEDLVLPPTTRDKIHELIAFARNRKRVLQDWQLTDKFAYGTSLTALFSGPPGTGKTMVAGVIAQTLGLELYRIDLSRVMSKWVGETERNLSIVFDEAERSQAILLFDEADSLFAKRTQVTSVQDRYANLETNFLLQRIESYEGIAVLTTNFETSIDEAFLRRIRFRIRFELPSRKERKRLWRSLLPASVPKEEAIDLDFLASSFELPGGLIKNAVLRACVAAAEASKGVSTRLLAACAELELAETGRLVAERYRSALHAL